MQRLSKKLIIGILSSKAYRVRADGCRTTWVSELSRRPEVEAVFVVGDVSASEPSTAGDVLTVPCPDDYESLPQKVRHFVSWALERYDFEYLFKCDDDTYVCVPRLLRLLQRETFDRAYIGARCSNYAQGGAGYLLSRHASGIVAKGLKALPAGPEDLFVGQVLCNQGIYLSDDWRFRADCWPANLPRSDNRIITCHRCRPWEMGQIHTPFAGMTGEPDVGDSLITVHAWAADFGMLGLGSDLGFSVNSRSQIQTSLIDIDDAAWRLFSAHATSRLIVDVNRPVSVTGFLDDAARGRPDSPVGYAVDDRQLGTLCGPGVSTARTLLMPGRHTLQAVCQSTTDNGGRYAVWAARPVA